MLSVYGTKLSKNWSLTGREVTSKKLPPHYNEGTLSWNNTKNSQRKQKELGWLNLQKGMDYEVLRSAGPSLA